VDRSSSGPGLARADRVQNRRFLAIASDVGLDPEATDAFVFAYEALAKDERLRLVDALMKDLARAGKDPGRAIAALFLTEEDPALIDHLYRALRTGSAAAPPPAVAFEVGHEAEGGVLLAIPDGTALAALVVTWSEHDAHVTLSTVPSSVEAIELLRGGSGGVARACVASAAVDLAAARMWQFLAAGGALPAGVERFAPLFSA
jgi:hypothetical protein